MPAALQVGVANLVQHLVNALDANDGQTFDFLLGRIGFRDHGN